MNYLEGFVLPTLSTDGGVTSVFKLLFFIILLGYVFFAFLLTLRVRILADTVEVGSGKRLQAIVYIHLVIALLGSFVAFLISLLA